MPLRHVVNGACAAGLVTAVVLGTVAGSAHAAPATREVSYRGYSLTVPADWRVVDLAANPTTCVRTDQHAVYLGTPGWDQQCPSHVIGRTESIVIEPLSSNAVVAHANLEVLGSGRSYPERLARSVGQDVQYAVPAAGVVVSASYGAGFDELTGVLRSARLDRTARATAMPAVTAATTPSIAATDTNYTGLGFDACNAPSSALMAAWTSSSTYRAIGVYFGGSHRACSAQPNLTPAWLTEQAGRGWHFLPIYVGTQASGLGTGAAAKGTAEADDAVLRAGALGMPPGSVLYNDMESYAATYKTNVLNYLAAWTAELHAKGYKSGVYSSLLSGVRDLNGSYGSTSPDVIWFASYNNAKNTDTSYIDASHWADHQRAHQYSGGVDETHGGYTLNIDGDYLDVQVAGDDNPPPPPSWPTVVSGNRGERVKTVQYLLNQQQTAGLDVDGDFGPATLAAVKTFQTAHSLPASGQVDAATWQQLVVTVQQGSRGDAVKALQSQLSAHGITTEVDGDFGAITNTNLRTFQTRSSLPATGVADGTTWMNLVY
ncbi:glycoside hydrolase domain-containing protein [Kribbella sp. NPDC051586]|uniref:glycoside hydrolase domain-containing protein n=1 Tax=Kribbella sp. NPDC051586 TaxID=3364118 RepID=UPI0037939CAE